MARMARGSTNGTPSGDSARPAPLTHEQRRRLIEQPFLTQRIPGKTWGGLWIREDPLPTEGRRRYAPTPEDESWFNVMFPEAR